ncbi:hypothetical protein SAMN05216593_10977 [Pseudomonas asturiensis]|uniref:Uncharacterized protein n=1 Tax=Pseudomonas asturiensis TaxID=1190415 RepID=A0A1M7PAR6_9PSED|nr:hypothetical protein SAMN05216593_10977 [Pseudomonas asturiensis]
MRRLSFFSQCEAAGQVKSASLRSVGGKTHSFKMQSGVGKQGVNQPVAHVTLESHKYAAAFLHEAE